MNRFLQRIHYLFGYKSTKNPQVETLKAKIIREKQKDIREVKKTNGIIKVMIERGEIELKIVKK